MDIDNFAEKYLDIELLPYHKEILKAFERGETLYCTIPRRAYKRNLIEYQIEMAKALKMNFIVRRYDRIERYENGKLVKVEKLNIKGE